MAPAEPGRLRVLVASQFIAPVDAAIRRAFHAHFDPRRDVLAALGATEAPIDAVFVSLENPLPEEAIRALPGTLRAIATYSVGTDHIDLEAARSRGLAVFHTPGVLADAVAENAFLLMLGAARRATESIELLRSGNWRGWSPTQLVGTQLSGKRLGILGMGDIGLRVARRARAFDMDVHYCNRRPAAAAVELGAAHHERPESLAAAVDVFLLACPSTPETRGVLGDGLLRAAKPGLIVVNIARGDLVDDAALLAALRDGRVGAAGLDVFAGEPDLHPDYLALPNVFALPHIGSSTLEARLGMGNVLIDGIQAWSRGEHPPNRIC
ncbi:MAG: D-glycerate dehydrogenase [Myxococcota bacterium]